MIVLSFATIRSEPRNVPPFAKPVTTASPTTSSVWSRVTSVPVPLPQRRGSPVQVTVTSRPTWRIVADRTEVPALSPVRPRAAEVAAVAEEEVAALADDAMRHLGADRVVADEARDRVEERGARRQDRAVAVLAVVASLLELGEGRRVVDLPAAERLHVRQEHVVAALLAPVAVVDDGAGRVAERIAHDRARVAGVVHVAGLAEAHVDALVVERVEEARVLARDPAAAAVGHRRQRDERRVVVGGMRGREREQRRERREQADDEHAHPQTPPHRSSIGAHPGSHKSQPWTAHSGESAHPACRDGDYVLPATTRRASMRARRGR